MFKPNGVLMMHLSDLMKSDAAANLPEDRQAGMLWCSILFSNYCAAAICYLGACRYSGVRHVSCRECYGRQASTTRLPVKVLPASLTNIPSHCMLILPVFGLLSVPPVLILSSPKTSEVPVFWNLPK